MTKQYITNNELLEMLERDKNIMPKTMSEKVFKENSYVSIINPYKDFLCLEHEDGKHRTYPEQVNFKDFKQLKMIDDFISNRLFIYIKCFEQALKAYLTSTLVEKMISLGDITCNDYSAFKQLLIDEENKMDMLNIYQRYQNTTIIKADKKIKNKNKEVITKIIRLGLKAEKSSNSLYIHYQRTCDVIPITIIIEQLTFGELQTLFNLLKLKDRIEFVTQICGERKNNRYISSFSNKINYIRKLRNIISHGVPIISFINNCITENEKHQLIKIIKLLKFNYYRSQIHDNSKILQPIIDIIPNQFNYQKLELLNWILQII